MKKKFLTLLTLGLLIGSPVFAADGGSALDGAGAAPNIRNDFDAYSRALIESIRSGGKLQEDDEVSIAKTMISNAAGTLDKMAVSVLNNLTQARQTEADFKTIAGFEENLAKATRGKKSRNKPFTLDKDGLLRVYRIEKEQVQDFPEAVEALLKLYTAEKTYFQKNPAKKKSKGPDYRVAALTIIIAELKAIQVTFRSEAGQARAAKKEAEKLAASKIQTTREAEAQKILRERAAAKKLEQEKAGEAVLQGGFSQTNDNELDEGINTIILKFIRTFGIDAEITQTVIRHMSKNKEGKFCFSVVSLLELEEYLKKQKLIYKEPCNCIEDLLVLLTNLKTRRIPEFIEKRTQNIKAILQETFANDPKRLQEELLLLPTVSDAPNIIEVKIRRIEQHVNEYNGERKKRGEISEFRDYDSSLTKADLFKPKFAKINTTQKTPEALEQDLEKLAKLKEEETVEVSFCPVHGFDHPNKCKVAKKPLSQDQSIMVYPTHVSIEGLKKGDLLPKDYLTHLLEISQDAGVGHPPITQRVQLVAQEIIKLPPVSSSSRERLFDLTGAMTQYDWEHV